MNYLEYKKVLPSDATLLGTTAIHNGKWSYECEIPKQSSGDGENVFYIAVVNDEGILSGTMVETLDYDKFELNPASPKVGQKSVQFSLSGILKGKKVMFLLYKMEPNLWEQIGETDFIEAADGEVSSSLRLPEKALTSGQYRLEAKIVPLNWNSKDGFLVNIIDIGFQVK